MQHNSSPFAISNLSPHTNYPFSVSSDDKRKDILSPKSYSFTDLQKASNSFFVRDFNWEYFSNELEFE